MNIASVLTGVLSAAVVLTGAVRGAVSSTGQEADGIAAGLGRESGARLIFNEKNGRLEIRDDLGNLVDEIIPGSISRTVDVGGQEYRVSFGKDTMGRPSALVRPGPAMRKPLLVELFGRKAVLSPNASLVATLAEERRVFYEPSICGEVYYIEEVGGPGSKVSRLAASKREVAVLAKPTSLPSVGDGQEVASREYEKNAEKAGDAFRSAVLTVFGLPDKQPSGKAKVYRLRSAGETEDAPDVAKPVSAEAGRP